jgi:hypothetical protein
MSALPKVAALVLALLPGPQAVDGWTLREPPRTYSPRNLYDYIDGNADLFQSYGFRQVGVADYVRQDGEDGWITVDIYDMGAPLHAFGIYTAERPPDPSGLAVGVQGYAEAGLIAFWTGPYYVKVSLAAGDDLGAACALAAAADRRIRRATSMPAEIGRLPESNRVTGSERYIKAGALGHDFLVEVVCAEYTLSPTEATLYIADLGDREKAAEGLQKLREFEAFAGEKIDDIPGVGEGAFAASDPYYGELRATWADRFVYVAIGEDADSARLEELLRRAIAVRHP